MTHISNSITLSNFTLFQQLQKLINDSLTLKTPLHYYEFTNIPSPLVGHLNHHQIGPHQIGSHSSIAQFFWSSNQTEIYCTFCITHCTFYLVDPFFIYSLLHSSAYLKKENYQEKRVNPNYYMGFLSSNKERIPKTQKSHFPHITNSFLKNKK